MCNLSSSSSSSCYFSCPLQVPCSLVSTHWPALKTSIPSAMLFMVRCNYRHCQRSPNHHWPESFKPELSTSTGIEPAVTAMSNALRLRNYNATQLG